MESNVVSRVFCDSLDRWVSVRECGPVESARLIKNIPKVSGKKSYYNLVISYCIVDYLTSISNNIEKDPILLSVADVIQDELYALSIHVNPNLDIRKVRIADSDNKMDIPLLEMSSKLEELGIHNVESMEKDLGKFIIGQDDAIQLISKCIRRAACGLKHPRRPVSTFTFVGRTGVGKTEMARALQRILYNDTEENLIRVDCSEYSLSHEYAKLLGAPPGYIGYNDGGYLSESMKKKQHAILLFDEIEKAHLKVHNLLLQIMDDGRLTDSKGRVLDFSKTVIVMTSNVGVGPLEEIEKAIGFGNKNTNHSEQSRQTVKDLERKFSPEFINRIDEVIVFKDLTTDNKIHIVVKMLEEIKERTEKLGIQVEFSSSIPEFIVEKEDNAKYGARPLSRAIKRYIEFPLSDRILQGRNPDILKVSVRKGKVIFNTEN